MGILVIFRFWWVFWLFSRYLDVMLFIYILDGFSWVLVGFSIKTHIIK